MADSWGSVILVTLRSSSFINIIPQVSQTISRGGPRSQVAIPAQGMIEFRDALTDLLDEFGGDEGSREEEKITSKFIFT